jgi:hypothetical protein
MVLCAFIRYFLQTLVNRSLSLRPPPLTYNNRRVERFLCAGQRRFSNGHGLRRTAAAGRDVLFPQIFYSNVVPVTPLRAHNPWPGLPPEPYRSVIAATNS